MSRIRSRNFLPFTSTWVHPSVFWSGPRCSSFLVFCVVLLCAQLFVGGIMFYLSYLHLFAHSGVQLILCCVFLCLVYNMLPVSLGCPCLIAPSVLPDVYCLCLVYHMLPVSLGCHCLIVPSVLPDVYCLCLVYHMLTVSLGCPCLIVSSVLPDVYCLCLVYPMLPVSLGCPFLIAPSVFSDFYITNNKNN
jgi:hypothetical protein